MITLRKYQNEAIETIIKRFEDGITRQLVALPTGTGKTICFAELTRKMNTKTLIIAHTDELVSQAIEKIRLVIPDVDIGKVKAGDNEHDKQIVVASIQTISRDSRLAELKKYAFKLLICDECHHSNANSYIKVFTELGFMAGYLKNLLVGFTATPKRADNKALGDIFEEITYEKNILDMIKSGYLADIRGKRILTGVDLDGIKTVAGDFSNSELASVVNTDKRNELIVKAYQEHAEGKKAIAFCVNVQHSKDLAECFSKHRYSARAIYGDMKDEERKLVLNTFSRNSLDIITNCMVLTEGFDEPGIQSILMTRPTKSSALYTQMVGRGTRLFPGKKECLVLDFMDKHNKILSIGTLMGKKYKIKDEQSFLEIIEETEKKIKNRLNSNGNIIAEDMEMFERCELNWSVVNGSYKLAIGKNKYFVLLNRNGFYDAKIIDDDIVTETVQNEISLEMGTGIGEDYARRNKCSIFSDKNAGWRSNPATDKQIEMLKKFECSIHENMTKGEAATILDQVFTGKYAYKFEPATFKQELFLRSRGLWKDGMLKGEAGKIISSINKFNKIQ